MYPNEYYDLLRQQPPAAGQPFIFRVPGENWVRLLTVRYTLTTSAAVANRFTTVDYLDGDQSIIARIMSPNALAASLQRATTHMYDSGGFTLSGGGVELAPLHDIWLPPGYSVRVTAANIDVGDQISNVFLYTAKASTGGPTLTPNARPQSE